MGLVALRTGGVLAASTLCAAGMLLMATAIVAFVGIGLPKAYAVGFVLPVSIYAVCVAIAGKNELEPYDGRLPTAFIFRYVHQQLVTKTYVDLNGNPIPNFDPTAAARSRNGLGGMGGMGAGAITVESPDRLTFMLLAHILLALSLGWLGAKFAIRVYKLQHPQPSRNEKCDASKPPTLC